MKISKKRILEIIKEECGDIGMMDYGPHHDKYFDHTDDEGGMAKRQLYKTAKYAMMLHDALDDDDQLEGWVQSKITKAADYMGTVAHYLEYEMGMHMDDPEMDSEEEMEIVSGDIVPMDEEY
jgi:hypothetical protein